MLFTTSLKNTRLLITLDLAVCSLSVLFAPSFFLIFIAIFPKLRLIYTTLSVSSIIVSSVAAPSVLCDQVSK